jgi:RND superfamily putative drug exporter
VLVTFRSIVIPITAIILNLLSVAAAYGVLTMVFQHGLGELIGLPKTDGIVNWLRCSVRDPVRPLDGTTTCSS